MRSQTCCAKACPTGHSVSGSRTGACSPPWALLVGLALPPTCHSEKGASARPETAASRGPITLGANSQVACPTAEPGLGRDVVQLSNRKTSKPWVYRGCIKAIRRVPSEEEVVELCLQGSSPVVIVGYTRSVCQVQSPNAHPQVFLPLVVGACLACAFMGRGFPSHNPSSSTPRNNTRSITTLLPACLATIGYLCTQGS